MSRQWTTCLQETVKADDYIPFPVEARQVVEINHEWQGRSVLWHQEQHAGYVVLSQKPLEKENYVRIERTKVYYVDDPPEAGKQGQIRAPKKLRTRTGNYVEGQRVYYLAYEEMETEDNGRLFLLTEPQVMKLFVKNDDDGGDQIDGDQIRNAVMDLPNLLPVP